MSPAWELLDRGAVGGKVTCPKDPWEGRDRTGAAPPVVLLMEGGAEPSGRDMGQGRGCLQPPWLAERPLALRRSHQKATVMVTPVTCSPYSPFSWPQHRSAESALPGQHWDPPLRALGSQDRAGSGQPPFEPPPVPLSQGTQPAPGQSQPVPSSPRASPGHPQGSSVGALPGDPNPAEAARDSCPKSCPPGPVSKPGPSVSPQLRPRPWGKEPGACPGWLRRGPGACPAAPQREPQLLPPPARSSGLAVLGQAGSPSRSPAAAPSCRCSRARQARPQCGHEGQGGWQPAPGAKAPRQAAGSPGAFLEYKGAWETLPRREIAPITGVTSLRNALDCRALKMPGYLFLLDKADKRRTKDPPLCNAGCSGPAALSGRSRGGGRRMSSRQEAPSVAVVSPSCCGRKPRWVLHPAPGSSPQQPRPLPGSARHSSAARGDTQGSAKPLPPKCHRLPPGFHMSKGNSSEEGELAGHDLAEPGGVSSRSHHCSPRPPPCPARDSAEHPPLRPQGGGPEGGGLPGLRVVHGEPLGPCRGPSCALDRCRSRVDTGAASGASEPPWDSTELACPPAAAVR